MKLYRDIFKRVFDFLGALILLVLLSPLLIVAIILVKISSPGPAFFLQTRLGKDGTTFVIYKFRTMTDKKRSVDHEILKGDNEVTKIGYILRRTKIDELPQLYNVLIGDMSFVGPRPSMPKLAESFDENGKQRLKVRPGITGYSQVNGNIYLSWPQRWKYDRKYVENLSLPLDVKIILKTVLIVIFGEGKFKKDDIKDE